MRLLFELATLKFRVWVLENSRGLKNVYLKRMINKRTKYGEKKKKQKKVEGII